MIKMLMLVVLTCCFTGNTWSMQLKYGDSLTSKKLTEPVRIVSGNNVLQNLEINPSVIDHKNNCIKQVSQKSQSVQIIDSKFGEAGQVHISMIDPTEWVIDGCYFYKNRSSDKWHGQAISANSPTRLTIKNSLFRECEGTGVIIFHFTAKDILIENCVFIDCDGGNGIIASLAKSRGTKNIIVRNCTFINCGKKGNTGINWPYEKNKGYAANGNKAYNNVYINCRKIIWGYCERYGNIVDGASTVSSKKGEYKVHTDSLKYNPVDFSTEYFKQGKGAKLVDFNPGLDPDFDTPDKEDPDDKDEVKKMVIRSDGTWTWE